MVETMMLVARPKQRKTRWASLPHLARIISRKLENDHDELRVVERRGKDVRMRVGSVLLDLGSDHCKQQDLIRSTIQQPSIDINQSIFT